MSEDLRDRVSKLEARQELLEKVILRIDENVKFLIDRVARLEERVNHLSERISHVERSLSERINHIEKSLSERIDRIESRIDRIESKLWWIIGILISMWITIIITILFK